MKTSLRMENPYDFEKFVAIQCKAMGYEIVMPEANQKWYDIVLTKGREQIAVQVKNHKAKSNISQLQQFLSFLDLPAAASFTSGWFISASGFSKPALTNVETEKPDNLRLGISTETGILWSYNPDSASEEEASQAPPHPPEDFDDKLRYFGIFTCKGGVGKTTVAAHLAGAFALQGYDVILLDLDPDRNLRKLFLEDQESTDETASLYVPPHKKTEVGTTITVLNADEWDEKEYPDIKIVICDCSPVLSENPSILIRKFNYCVVPTTLNPLGIAKNGDVITRTFGHIRKYNDKAELFALINCYNQSKNFEKRNAILLASLQEVVRGYQKQDPRCQLIHPDHAKIRRSDSLQYWGYHIVDGSPPQLAFREVAGRSAPRTDFLQLAEYLEDHTSIRSITA
jgi:chromosome partitioning protein